MLLTTAIFWSIWITRNKITFEGYKLQNPVGIVFTACFFFEILGKSLQGGGCGEGEGCSPDADVQGGGNGACNADFAHSSHSVIEGP
jgi:hypothetical protein